MVKKLKAMADKKKSTGAAGLFDRALAGSVKDSAQQIWLAGLGAFSKAQEEGGKVFEALVKEGAGLQRKTQAAAEEKISEVTGKMSSMAGEVGAKAGQQWDKLETIFEERTAKAMGKLGVPSRKDVDTLVARIDELAAKVSKLAKQPAARATHKTAAKTPAPSAAKPAAKRARKDV